MRRIAVILALGLLAGWSGHARAADDAGIASMYPWSGYWWQHQSGGLLGPLTKYDRVSGDRAAEWERINRVEVATEPWFGYCHAWSSSSVMEVEPRSPRRVDGVDFGVGDQKGLLAACHDADVANTHGDRYGDGQGEEDPADLHPEELWRLLRLYIRQEEVPLILDLEATEQVWNHPVYQYEVEYAEAGDGWVDGVMTLVAADDRVVPDYVGTQYLVRRYTFRAQMQGGAVVLGSGRWTGTSARDHPDFAWYPFVAVAENPEIDVAQVSRIVGFEVGAGEAPPDVDAGRPADVVPLPSNSDRPPRDRRRGPDAGRRGRPADPVDPDDVLDPYGLVELVLNKTSDFALDIATDRGDGGKYRSGEPVRVSVRSGADGYLYLFDTDEEGDLRLVFPTRPETPNRIRADTLYDLPAGDGMPPFLVAEGQGRHDLKGIVTTRPIRIAGTPLAPQTQIQTPVQQSKAVNSATGPEPVVVPPSTRRQMSEMLHAGLNPKRSAAGVPGVQEVVGDFAQDMVAYFVLAPEKSPGIGSKP